MEIVDFVTKGEVSEKPDSRKVHTVGVEASNNPTRSIEAKQRKQSDETIRKIPWDNIVQ